MYAIVKQGGHQYTLREGDVFAVDLLNNEEGSSFEFENILAIGEGDQLEIGQPNVSGAKVKVEVVKAEVKDKKVIVAHFRRRKDSRTRKGHRQKHTLLKVVSIKK